MLTYRRMRQKASDNTESDHAFSGVPADIKGSSIIAQMF